MPAPRLLDKKVVNQELALQKKRDIETGLNLAKKVDAVRQTLGEEEKRLEEFRIHTVARIQVEIDEKIRERDSLIPEIAFLKEERIRAQAPIDLKEEWQKVREDAARNALWEENLGQSQLQVLAQEEDIRVARVQLKELATDTERKNELAERTLSEAEKKFSLASDALERTEREAQEILKRAQERDNHSKVREEDATLREVSLTKREEAVAAHELDLSSREKKLRTRQETFLKAQKYLQAKKK